MIVSSYNIQITVIDLFIYIATLDLPTIINSSLNVLQSDFSTFLIPEFNKDATNFSTQLFFSSSHYFNPFKMRDLLKFFFHISIQFFIDLRSDFLISVNNI